MFTGVIKLANIDDYIAPSQQCVKPMMEKAQEPIKQSVPKQEQKGGKATITLNDCLACSGCVTTAESLLVQQMSINEFLSKVTPSKGTQTKDRKTVMFISPQARASLANYYQLSQHQLMCALEKFIQEQFGAIRLLDMQEAIERCHALIVEEWLCRREQDGPILCSECPGWVCYAEKVAPKQVIPHMSKVKSPQQIMGSMLRDLIKEEGLYVVGIMPCYDKKLEAIRFDYQAGTKQVDLVLTAGEIIDLIKLRSKKECNCGGKDCTDCKCRSESSTEPRKELFPYQMSRIERSVDSFSLSVGSIQSVRLPRTIDPKCNGYIHILIAALEVKEFKTKQIRNSDFVQYEFQQGNTTVRMAQCFGFRNIQNIVRSIKQGKCNYSYIEIMACPTGCFNGGGQPKIGESKPKEVAAKLETDTKNQCESRSSNLKYVAEPRYLTQYHSLQKSISTMLLNW